MERLLSDSEAFFVNYQISVQMVIELEGLIQPDVLRSVCNALAARHPFLRCQILRAQDKLFFVKKSSVEIPFQVYQNQNRDDLIQTELNQPLDESQDLMRVAMLLESESKAVVIFMIHHAICDGLSGVSLLNDILEGYQEYLQKGAMTFHDPLPLQSSIEDLSASLVSPEELSEYIEQYAIDAKANRLHAIPPNLDVDPSAGVIHLHNLRFSPEITQHFIQTCRRNNASIHSVIAAANLLAIRQLLDADDHPMMLRCNSPVDLRQRLQSPLSQKHLLSAATGCGTNHAVSRSTSIWDLAEDISQSISTSIQNRDIFKAHLTFMETLLKHHLPHAVGVSSVGNIKLPKQYQQFECHSLSITGVFRLPMFGATTYTFGEVLTLTYLYVEPYYTTELIKIIAEDVKKRLIELVQH